MQTVRSKCSRPASQRSGTGNEQVSVYPCTTLDCSCWACAMTRMFSITQTDATSHNRAKRDCGLYYLTIRLRRWCCLTDFKLLCPLIVMVLMWTCCWWCAKYKLSKQLQCTKRLLICQRHNVINTGVNQRGGKTPQNWNGGANDNWLPDFLKMPLRVH